MSKLSYQIVDILKKVSALSSRQLRKGHQLITEPPELIK